MRDYYFILIGNQVLKRLKQNPTITEDTIKTVQLEFGDNKLLASMGIRLATRTYKGSLNKLLEPFGLEFASVKQGGGIVGYKYDYYLKSSI